MKPTEAVRTNATTTKIATLAVSVEFPREVASVARAVVCGIDGMARADRAKRKSGVEVQEVSPKYGICDMSSQNANQWRCPRHG